MFCSPYEHHRTFQQYADWSLQYLLDDQGHRAPSKPIFELEDGESLDDAAQHGDGLYIAKKTVDGDHHLNF